MKTPYFELGNLKLDYEHTLMEYDSIPLLFVCVSQANRGIKYLCMCNSINRGFRWVVVKTSTEILRKLIRQKISINEAFKKSEEPYYLITEKNEDVKYCLADFEGLKTDDELPAQDLYLDF